MLVCDPLCLSPIRCDAGNGGLLTIVSVRVVVMIIPLVFDIDRGDVVNMLQLPDF